MRKITFLILLVFISFTLGGTDSFANSCTGFENDPACRPEWNQALQGCEGDPFIDGTGQYNYSYCFKVVDGQKKLIPICSEAYQEGPCSPERINPYASENLSLKAEQEGALRGYDIQCSTKAEGWPAGYYDANTGLGGDGFLYYNTNCVVNGCEGISASILLNTDTGWNVLENDLNQCKLGQVDETQGTQSPIPTTISTGSFTTQIMKILTDLTKSLQNQLYSVNSTNQTSFTSQQTSTTGSTSFTSSMMNLLNQTTRDLQNQLYSTGSTGSQTTTNQTQTSVPRPDPFVSLTLLSGVKSGIYSVGELIQYYITMRNVDSVRSFFTATPGDSCPNSSNSGEQVPWVVKAVGENIVFGDVVKQCQSGSNYVITVAGTNTTTGKTSASSISVLIR